MDAGEWRCPYAHCATTFTMRKNRDRHVRTRHQNELRQALTCEMCGKHFSRIDSLTRHSRIVHKKRKTSPSSRNQQQSKRTQEATTSRNAVEVNSYQDEIEKLPSDIRDQYIKNAASIRTHTRRGKHLSTYNIAWPVHSDHPEWNDKLLEIFDEQKTRFKINYSFHFLMRNKETSQLSFFHASANNHAALKTPRLIQSKQDFLNFLNDLNEKDVLEHVQNERPNSKVWIERILATSFYVYKIAEFPIGCADADDDFLKHERYIHTLLKDKKKSFPYKDNLCFFRCLALHRGADLKNLQTPTVELFNQWAGHPPPSDFQGISISQLDDIEKKFETNVEVFQFDESQTPPVLMPFRRSAFKHTETLRVLFRKKHFMYIIDIDQLGHALACHKCNKLFPLLSSLKKHEKVCKGGMTKHRYQGGVYTSPQNIFQKLQSHGIDIDDPSFVFPFRATFDFECYFATPDKISDMSSENTVYTEQHVPLSVAVASNVAGYTEPRCWVNKGDPQTIVDSMIDYLESISDEAYSILRERFDYVFEQLDDIQHTQDQTADNLNIPVSDLRQQFDSYLHELPVIGFNSGKYDINVIKPYIFSHFCVRCDKEEKEEPFRFVVKKNNNYMAIASDRLKFLDVVNFLAPGFSYAKYLKAFEVTEAKGFFCYEYIDSLDRLKETKLPPHEAFFSKLKNGNITDEEYAYCQRIWNERNMQTLEDFLVYYNVKDVQPFLTALERQIAIYEELGLDLLKEAISVPGITLRYLFQTLEDKRTYFSLFNKDQEQYHTLLRQNMTGGPSIIFHRYHEKDKTHIRGNTDKPVKSIQGYDANALYLYALMQEMPTEHPIIRHKTKDDPDHEPYRAEQTDVYGQQAREWLEYTAHSQGIFIQHKFNNTEKQLGNRRYRVDGWHADTHTAYQYHGCLFHGHDCYITRDLTTNPINGKSLPELREQTNNITQYLRENVGVTVIEMYECEWKRERKTNPNIREFLEKNKITKQCKRSYSSEKAVLDAIQSDELFGLVQCDVEVPHELRERFSELQPIFKNCLVSKDDIGDFMKKYAEKHNLLNQPRRTLVGSFFGKQIVLCTPLLKWYLAKQFEVSNVNLIIQYRPKSCFRSFGENVSRKRRDGDKNSSKAMLGDTFKLLGNSAYGKTLTNLAAHRDMRYVSSDEVPKMVNNPLFQKLTELSENLVEVESDKRNVNWNLPLQIAFFVYSYAKLRMLQFHYDFLDKFVSRDDYQLLEMDTDSLYMALSAEKLEDVVRPEMQKEFYRVYNRWFPAVACDRHDPDFQASRLADISWDSGMCSDCLARVHFDKRTPGLFKTEFQGTAFIGLCSKTYFCEGIHENKVSCKGINKQQNVLTKTAYERVLISQESGGGTNTGFKTDGKSMFTYVQKRKSLSFLYIKRVVSGPDGISTKPTEV